MIQDDSQDYCLLVARHGLGFLEAPVDYLYRMTWMMVTSHVLLLLMTLTHQMFNQGTLIYPKTKKIRKCELFWGFYKYIC